MTIRCVTTCHLDGWNQYGSKLLSGWHHFPESCELVWYTEGYSIPDTERVTQIDNSTLTELQEFKKRHSFYRPPYYLWDVVRFSHKVFSVLDALKDHDGLGVWIDADIVPYADMPEDYMERLIGDSYIAMFRRKGMYSECGFWIVDCSHKSHGEFLGRLRSMYVDGKFKSFHEWHDSYLMDVVIRGMEREGLISIENLSGVHSSEGHPMARADIARYLDHTKGPSRKRLGVSPENDYRKAD